MFYVFIFVIGIFFGVCIGIYSVYNRITKDMRFSWQGKYYIIKQWEE